VRSVFFTYCKHGKLSNNTIASLTTVNSQMVEWLTVLAAERMPPQLV